MRNLANTRIIFTGFTRRPWYRVYLAFTLAILFAIAVWAFIFWCAAKAVR
jgi:hypothetical protein